MLELATAQLLAATTLPLMPRFAARLNQALARPVQTAWPEDVTWPEPGTPLALAGVDFFVALRDRQMQAAPRTTPAEAAA